LARKAGHFRRHRTLLTKRDRLNCRFTGAVSFGLGGVCSIDRAADAGGRSKRPQNWHPAIRRSLHPRHAYQDLGRKEEPLANSRCTKKHRRKIQHNTETVSETVSGVPAPDSGRQSEGRAPHGRRGGRLAAGAIAIQPAQPHFIDILPRARISTSPITICRRGSTS